MGNQGPLSDSNSSDIDLDLGFGKFVSSESRRRLLNRDGTFNVRRTGLGFFETVSVYHFLLEISWPRFLGLSAVWYFLANAAFAGVYISLGPGALIDRCQILSTWGLEVGSVGGGGIAVVC